MKLFIDAFCAHVHRGVDARHALCRYVIAAVLDMASNVRSCGPFWSDRMFLVERLIGTLPASDHDLHRQRKRKCCSVRAGAGLQSSLYQWYPESLGVH